VGDAPRGCFEVRVRVPCTGDWRSECVVAAAAAGRVSDADHAGEVEDGVVTSVELVWVEPTFRKAKKVQQAIVAAGMKATIREQ
jgi:hypothetical protein